MKIKDVAEMLGKNPQTIRVGLQLGVYPFGIAFKLPNSNRYNYTIYPQKVLEYIGGSYDLQRIESV